MDSRRFDRLAAALAADPSRRGVLRLIAGGLAAVFGRMVAGETAAKKKRNKKKKCRRSQKKCGRRCISKTNCCTSAECDEGEVCRNGTCSNCVTADDCPPPSVCEDAVCEDGRCATVRAALGSHCSTNQFCVGNETCDADGECVGGVPRDCDDGIDCTVDACDEFINECTHAPDDDLCPGDQICDPEQGCRCPDSLPDSCGEQCFNEGAFCNTGLPGVCAPGSTQCVGTQPECVPDVLPGTQTEICNGIDDDCDGAIDEGPGLCPVEAPSTCGHNGMCVGGTCQKYGPETVCRSASCAGSTLQLEARCDGNGSCPESQAQSCAPYMCLSSGTGCIGSCGGDGDCVPDHFCGGGVCRPDKGNGEACQFKSECASDFCDNGTCQPKRANGETCSDQEQCASNICFANVCCSTSCNVGQSCEGGTCHDV